MLDRISKFRKALAQIEDTDQMFACHDALATSDVEIAADFADKFTEAKWLEYRNTPEWHMLHGSQANQKAGFVYTDSDEIRDWYLDLVDQLLDKFAEDYPELGHVTN